MHWRSLLDATIDDHRYPRRDAAEARPGQAGSNCCLFFRLLREKRDNNGASSFQDTSYIMPGNVQHSKESGSCQERRAARKPLPYKDLQRSSVCWICGQPAVGGAEFDLGGERGWPGACARRCRTTGSGLSSRTAERLLFALVEKCRPTNTVRSTRPEAFARLSAVCHSKPREESPWSPTTTESIAAAS